MPRRLKTYQTSQGFFDLAIAAPSMKAALEAWGSDMNLFHKGFAFETDDAKIVQDTLQKPGIVLKRPVGTKQRFTENAHLPKELPSSAKPVRRPKPEKKAKAERLGKAVSRAAKKAAAAYEKEERKLKKEREKRAASDANRRARRERATAKAEAALAKARKKHDSVVDRLDNDREAIKTRARTEEARWDKLKDRLEEAIREASR